VYTLQSGLPKNTHTDQDYLILQKHWYKLLGQYLEDHYLGSIWKTINSQESFTKFIKSPKNSLENFIKF